MPGRKPGLPNDAAARPAGRARRHEQHVRVARGVPGINVLLYRTVQPGFSVRPPEKWPFVMGDKVAYCPEFGRRMMAYISRIYLEFFAV
jgi:hypothetical protein